MHLEQLPTLQTKAAICVLMHPITSTHGGLPPAPVKAATTHAQGNKIFQYFANSWRGQKTRNKKFFDLAIQKYVHFRWEEPDTLEGEMTENGLLIVS